jgi:hypothetical protein
MEFGWWAALYARFGVPYPLLSYIVVWLIGGLFASGIWWLTAEAYKKQQRELEARPVVEDVRPQLEAANVRLAQVEERLRQASEAAQNERTEKERALEALDQREKRRTISSALGAFMLRGRDIQQRCANEAQPAPVADAEAWAPEVERYMAAELGDAYVARFRSAAGIPIAATSISSQVHRRVWSFMHTRLARLDQFLQELAR